MEELHSAHGAEAAFRVLKSPLSIRPIFHQLERRAKAIFWWRFSAMHCGHAETLLRRKGSALSRARRWRYSHSDQRRHRTAYDGREGNPVAARHTPDAKQKELLDQLGITVPDRLSFDRECSVDLATA